MIKNQKGLYICKGRIKGEYPEYIPDKSAISDKFIEHQGRIQGEFREF